MFPAEAQISPYQVTPVPSVDTVLVLAPHPDDEVFGCGGSIALHAQNGHQVHVILLTSGEFQEDGGANTSYGAARVKESRDALDVLAPGSSLEIWGLPDRGVVYDESLVERIMNAIREKGVQLVYAPSTAELHPDHRALALAAIEAVRRSGSGVSLGLYEVSAPLRPNRLVDVSQVWGRKVAAMNSFSSQEARLPYSEFITSLNRFRALTVQAVAQYVEAFEWYDGGALAAGGPLMVQTQRRHWLLSGLAVLPDDNPLVSVVIRTLGRATIAQALQSIAVQSYRHLEVVVVDAGGRGLPGLDLLIPGVSVRLISESGQAMGRAAAANRGVEAANGKMVIFLDDDDYLYADHIAKLVLARCSASSARAVHTGVECVDDLGRPLGRSFEFPYSPGELAFGNFLPIHSVLFDRDLWGEHCRFDEAFDLYEDWDFWLQLERLTSLVYVPGVSAAYRIHGGGGAGVSVDRSSANAATQKIHVKWGLLENAAFVEQLVARALATRELQQRIERVAASDALTQAQLHESEQRLRLAMESADRARIDAHELRLAHDAACRQRDQLQEQMGQAWVAIRHHQSEVSTLRKDLSDAHTAIHVSQNESARLKEELLHTVESTAAAEAQLHNELQLSRNHSAHLESSLGAVRHELSAVLTSTSWRVSRPVRWVGTWVRRVKYLTALLRVTRAKNMGWATAARKAWSVYRQEGVSGVRMRARNMLASRPSVVVVSERGEVVSVPVEPTYEQWARQYDTLTSDHLRVMREQLGAWDALPLVSVVMPVFNAQIVDLQRAVASVQAQVYSNWELCICDDASTDAAVSEYLQHLSVQDVRVRVTTHQVNRHISHATNSALSLAKGDFIAFLDQDDELRPHALFAALALFREQPQVQLLYSDEDKIDQSGRRFDPYFKPDFNLGLLRSHNYMCHFAVYRRPLLVELGGLRPGFEGAQDYDLALRAVDYAGERAVGHVPMVLYHWRTAVGSTASGHSNKSYAFEAGRRALEEHLKRRGLAGSIEQAPEAAGMYRVCWDRPKSPPLVSIVIPTRNGEAILRMCLDSLRSTAYPNYEVIVVDNGSDDPSALEFFRQREQSGQIRVLRDESPFNFSALNNHAVRKMAKGEFILMMNNDIEITHPEWLDEMVGAAYEPGVGCVGARLWYPDGRLQHGGVILVCGVAGHAHKFLARGAHGYMGRAVLAQDFVAVTAACLLVRRSIFDEVGGLDEGLAVAFNDVDFCLKVHSAGYRNHWTPHAQLVHHESISRGYEDTPEKQARFKGEIDTLQQRWTELLKADPCYSPNLTANAEDFSLAWPPRAGLQYLIPTQ